MNYLRIHCITGLLLLQLCLLARSRADFPYLPMTINTMARNTPIGDYHYDSAGRRLANTAPHKVHRIVHGLIGKAEIIAQENGNPVQFRYAVGGNRFFRLHGKDDKTLYIGDVEYRIGPPGGKIQRIVYIRHGSYAPFTQVDITNPTHPSYHFFVQDHLGSPLISVNNDGFERTPKRYEPWGMPVDANGVRVTQDETVRGFTGHEHIAAVGFIHMNGRIYDSEVGLFIEPDSIIKVQSRLPYLNRYNYVENSPLAATDPSGYTGEKINDTLPGLWDFSASEFLLEDYTSHASFKDATYRFVSWESGLINIHDIVGTMEMPIRRFNIRPKRISGEGEPPQLKAFILNAHKHYRFERKTALGKIYEEFMPQEVLGYWNKEGRFDTQLAKRFSCNCHGYSLGAGAWINDSEATKLFTHPAYFSEVREDFLKGDIVIWHKNNAIFHSAVISEPHADIMKSKVKHMPGVRSIHSIEAPVNTIARKRGFKIGVVRPASAIR